MTLKQLQTQLVELLSRNGLQSMAAWPKESRVGTDNPVVLVALEKMSCAPAGLQDYLGQQLQEATGQWQELYGRKVQLSLTMDILALPEVGAQACTQVMDLVVRCFQTEKPVGLNVKELTGEEVVYDEKEGLLKLRCRLKCEGWLCTAGDEAGTFLDFTLRGDVNV